MFKKELSVNTQKQNKKIFDRKTTKKIHFWKKEKNWKKFTIKRTRNKLQEKHMLGVNKKGNGNYGTEEEWIWKNYWKIRMNL